jgi:hypothetical protein
MNVIIYWKSGDYADVYDVDKVQKPSSQEPDLRLFRKHKGQDFEVARFEGGEVRGFQIFLTAKDA